MSAAEKGEYCCSIEELHFDRTDIFVMLGWIELWKVGVEKLLNGRRIANKRENSEPCKERSNHL